MGKTKNRKENKKRKGKGLPCAHRRGPPLHWPGPAQPGALVVYLPTEPSSSVEAERGDDPTTTPAPSRPPRTPSPRHESAQTPPLLSPRSLLPRRPLPCRFRRRPSTAAERAAVPARPTTSRRPTVVSLCTSTLVFIFVPMPASWEASKIANRTTTSRRSRGPSPLIPSPSALLRPPRARHCPQGEQAVISPLSPFFSKHRSAGSPPPVAGRRSSSSPA